MNKVFSLDQMQVAILLLGVVVVGFFGFERMNNSLCSSDRARGW